MHSYWLLWWVFWSIDHKKTTRTQVSLLPTLSVSGGTISKFGERVENVSETSVENKNQTVAALPWKVEVHTQHHSWRWSGVVHAWMWKKTYTTTIIMARWAGLLDWVQLLSNIVPCFTSSLPHTESRRSKTESEFSFSQQQLLNLKTFLYRLQHSAFLIVECEF